MATPAHPPAAAAAPATRKKYFISRAGADADWAQWVGWQIEEAGHDVVIQDWDFLPGDEVTAKMEDALKGCDKMIAILSSAYFAGSKYIDKEWEEAYQLKKILPFRVQRVELPERFAKLVWIDLAGLDEAAAQEAVLQGIQRAGASRAKPEQRPSFPARSAASAVSSTVRPGTEPKDEPNDRTRGWSVAAGLAAVAALGAWALWPPVEPSDEWRAEVYAMSGLGSSFDEASGGAVDRVGSLGYVVDDEEKDLFEIDLKRELPSRRAGDPPLQWGEPLVRRIQLQPALEPGTGKPSGFDDLEAAVFHDGKLYLATSHSQGKKLKQGQDCDDARMRLIEAKVFPRGHELSVDGRRYQGAILREASLRCAVLSFLQASYGPRQPLHTLEDFDIEGLAMDARGRVYLGLRAPKVVAGSSQSVSLVLSAELEALFQCSPELCARVAGCVFEEQPGACKPDFRDFPLNLADDAAAAPEEEGVADMALDVDGEHLLILAGEAKPTLWRWRIPNGADWDPPQQVAAGFWDRPAGNAGRLEALLAHRNDIHLFADAEGLGGYRRFSRGELNLPAQ